MTGHPRSVEELTRALDAGQRFRYVSFDPRAEKPRAWRGLNLLGSALADVRAQLGSRSGSPAAR